mgnify:CR=1 FL=1
MRHARAQGTRALELEEFESLTGQGLRGRLDGATLLLGTRALNLRMAGGQCVGVEAEQNGARVNLDARNVVISDGGFQANLDMLKEYISPAPEKIRQRNAQTAKGDGVKMARAAGAKLVGMNRFYGHVLIQDALTNDDLWPFPMMDEMCCAGVMVDTNGRRFVDEGAGGVYLANHIAGMQDPLSTIVVFDHPVWDGPAKEFITPANPLLVTNGGTVHKANTITELWPHILHLLLFTASVLGLGVKSFKHTLD